MSSTVVLITGANSGIGFETAKVIASASEDYHVIMTGRSMERVTDAMSEIKTAGVKGQLSVLRLDVTDQTSIDEAASAVEKQFGRLDVLINNAAIGNMGADVRTRFQQSLETNLIGPAAVSAAFRALLLRSQKPRSIYVTSGLGSLSMSTDPTTPTYHAINPIFDAYSASKAALNMLMIYEARQFSPKGLKLWAVCPGLVRSNLRGKTEEARSAGGRAGDPRVSGETILSIIEGKRDADVGKFIHKDGLYPW